MISIKIKVSRLLMLGLIFLLSTISCTEFRGESITPPRVSLVNIQIQEIKLFETVMELELRVLNTNDVALHIKGIDCSVALNGKNFASGVSDIRADIPPFNSDTVFMTLYSSVIDVAKAFLQSTDKQELTYSIYGKVHFSGESTSPSFSPFHSEGTVSLNSSSYPSKK